MSMKRRRPRLESPRTGSRSASTGCTCLPVPAMGQDWVPSASCFSVAARRGRRSIAWSTRPEPAAPGPSCCAAKRASGRRRCSTIPSRTPAISPWSESSASSRRWEWGSPRCTASSSRSCRRVIELPEPQREALEAAFGLRSDGRGDIYLVGLAALTLLGDAAQRTSAVVRRRRHAVARSGVDQRLGLRRAPRVCGSDRAAVRGARALRTGRAHRRGRGPPPERARRPRCTRVARLRGRRSTRPAARGSDRE